MLKVGVMVKNGVTTTGTRYRNGTVYVSDTARCCGICGHLPKGARFLCLTGRDNAYVCEECIGPIIEAFRGLTELQREGKHVFPSLP